jgi:uncharacterized membrane protein YbhN (UPF0104 family)
MGLVALVYTIEDLGPRTFGHYFRMIGWWWIAVLAFEVAITSFDALAIRAFASPDQVPWRGALLAQLAGRSVNAVTPSGNLGEPVKISVLTDHVDNSRAVSTILLYNIVGFAVELWQVALAAPIMALLVPMPESLRILFISAGIVSLVLAVLVYLIVRAGVLASIARIAVRLHLLSAARFERWSVRIASIDDKLRLVAGARRRDRIIGIAAIVLSRAMSLAESLLLLELTGVGMSIHFIAAYTVGGFVIYMLSSLVPMGLGIAEAGYYGLFAELGYKPSLGVMIVLARRVVLIAYATLGLFLVMASETVRRARDTVPADTDDISVGSLPVAPATVTKAAD